MAYTALNDQMEFYTATVFANLYSVKEMNNFMLCTHLRSSACIRFKVKLFFIAYWYYWDLL